MGISSVVSTLEKLEVYAISVPLFTMAVVTFVDVVLRYFFNAPVRITYEGTELLLGTVIFAALPQVVKRRDLISVDLIDQWFPRLSKRLIKPLDFMLMIVLAILSILVWSQAGKLRAAGVTTEEMRFPVAYLVYAMSVSLAVSALVSFANIFYRNEDAERPGNYVGKVS